jgi:hypothetical protein
MSIKKCINEIQRAAKRSGVELLEDEILDILDILERRVKRRTAGGTNKSESELIIEEAAEITRQAKINAAIQKRNRLINAKRYATVKQRLNAEPKNRGKILSEIMVGSLRHTEAGRLSVDGRGHAIMTDSVGLLLNELEKQDLTKLFASGQLDELIYRELFDGLGTSGNKEAQQIAAAIQRVQKSLLRRKNRAGSNIRELRNYVVRQSHDPILLRDAGFEKWRNDIMPLLDLEATFKNVEPGQTDEEFLRAAYDGLVTGIHQKTEAVYGQDGKVDPLTAFKGPSNLAKKLSAERVLHFKDGKSSHQYSKKYSRMRLSEAVLNGITHDAQSIALMETFGTNPRAMFDRLMKEIREEAPDVASLDRINKRRLENQFAELDGTTRARGAGKPILMGVDFAGISAAWRMIQNMAKLGFATISSISDIATKASFISQTTGRSILSSYARAFGDIFAGFSQKEQRDLAYLLNVGTENFIGDVHARFGANDSGPGMVAKAHQFFFKLNGMQWWNDSQKTGLARMMAADLAMNKNKTFSGLHKDVQNNLSLYGIGEAEWDLMRTVNMKAADGREYLVPAAVNDLTPEQIDPIIREKTSRAEVSDSARQEFIDDLRTKIATYYTDAADTAIPTPGARERAIMNQGTSRGTVLGEAIRALMQLKGFPITYLTKGMTRQFYGARAGGRSGALAIMQMVTGTTIMGYLAMSMKDILKGREPREVFSKDTVLKTDTLQSAFLQGGGAGILGDYMFGEFNRYGQSFTQTLAGPTFGSIDDVFKMFAKFRDGDEVAADAVRFGIRNTPYINLFYTKTAMDYLVLYGLTEKMNPGYLKRMEKRIAKEQGQEFYFPPSRYAVQY